MTALLVNGLIAMVGVALLIAVYLLIVRLVLSIAQDRGLPDDYPHDVEQEP